MKKRLAPLESLDDESEPGTSKANSNNENGRNIRGSLEDCEYSPIRPVHVRNVTSLHQPPFISSTPIVSAKRRRTIVSTLEDSDISHKVKNDVKVVATKKMRKVDLKNGNKCGKIRKLSTTGNTKLSREKTRAQIIPETSGIATRLRSRQTVISFPAQRPSVELSK
uniref:Shugoshin_C domain-containing protein n=1 Tax=Elaeophora elaphi TaxID=1147741 RepID=A0A0R3RLE3_9BILA